MCDPHLQGADWPDDLCASCEVSSVDDETCPECGAWCCASCMDENVMGTPMCVACVRREESGGWCDGCDQAEHKCACVGVGA